MKRVCKSQCVSLMCAASASVAMLLGTVVNSYGQTTTISDTEFNNSDWTEQVSYNPNPTDWTNSVQQYTDGGNPGAFRGQTWQYVNNDDAASTILATTNLLTAQTYNPATEGGFQYLQISMDDYVADVMNGSTSKIIALSPVIEQAGNLYDVGTVITQSATWGNNSWTLSPTSNYTHYAGNGPAAPDFSSAGAPLSFGYYDYLNVGPNSSPYNLFHAVDNFNVKIVQNVGAPTGGQYVVNVDLGNITAEDTYNGQGGIASPGNTWNAVSGSANPVIQLLDSQGNQTSVGISWKIQANNLQLLPNYVVSSTVFDSMRNSLMDDGSYDGTEGDLTEGKYGGEMYITGLVPNAHYNLALYGVAAGASETYLTKFTVNGVSQTPSGPIDNDDQGGNWIENDNVIADANGQIRVQVHNANYYDSLIGVTEGGIWTVNGFQVQSTGVANPTWTGGSGNWSAAGSWSEGAGAPSGAGAVAEFDNATGPTTVTLDGPQTVGVLGFNSSQKFTLAGSAITLDGNGYDSMINVTSGSHEIAAPINVANGEAEIVIANNASLKLSGKLTGLVSRVQLGLSSTLDITNNSLTLEYFGNDPYSELLANVSSAFDKGKWDGTGLTSSATATAGVGIGIVDNAAAGWTSFEGQSLADTSNVLIAPAWYGDANMDGVVDGADLTLMSAGESGALTGWQNGDFNYDGVVNADDAALFMLGFSLQTGAIGATVPEPAGAVLLLAAAPLLMRRRRRA